MKKIELLAPAGSLESLIGAVQSGADAVYLGGTKFSARAYASNFDNDKMRWVVEYCHKYGVKVYVTINTLIKNNEMQEALEYGHFLYTIGVDALIIQDIGFAQLLKKLVPDVEIHASTQMTVHNGLGAKYLVDKGFERIVLSRELSMNEVEYISKDLNIETEIFVHGALCICYSGQCLMSSMLGGRSGNRGRCAQTCRLPYSLLSSKEEKKGYLLSPKDINTVDEVRKIIKSGTSSLKIEGRMKRPEYVVGVVSSYRRAIDSIYEGIPFDYKKENEKLMQLFNREGFSKAYFFGNVGKDMMAYNFPKNTGVRLGKAKGNKILLETNVSVGDGVRVGDKGFTVSKIIKNNEEVLNGNKGESVILKPSNYKSNDILFKTQNSQLLKELSKSIVQYNKKIDLDIQVSFEVGKPMEITTTYQGKSYKVYGNKVDVALKSPLNKERIEKNLRKSGETPFRINSIEFIAFEDGFITISSINELRRNLIEKIENSIVALNIEKCDNINENMKEAIEKKGKDKKGYLPEFMVVVNTEEQLNAVKESDAAYVAVNIVSRKLNPQLIKEVKNKHIILKVPNIIKDSEFEKVCRLIDDLISYSDGILTGNLGIINKYNSSVNILGDYKLNVLNSFCEDFFENDLKGIYISPELNKSELMDLVSKTNKIPVGMVVYGKYELMVSEYCAIGSKYGGKSSKKKCDIACARDNYKLRDRKGMEFPVVTDINCKSYIYNSVPTNLINEISWLKKRKVNGFRLDFIDESYDEVLSIINNVLNDYQLDIKSYTRGHYKRGIE